MKRLYLIGILFLVGCYEHIPGGVLAQMTAERFLDSLYKPKKVEDEIGIGFISIPEYLNPTTRTVFQKDTNYCLSADGWKIFTESLNDILSKEERRSKGVIHIEGYRVSGVRYTTAFVIDSAFRKVYGIIRLK